MKELLSCQRVIARAETLYKYVRFNGPQSCPFCGHTFSAGDSMRFVISKWRGFRNFFVCEACDVGDEAMGAKCEKRMAEFLAGFGFFIEREQRVRLHYSEGKLIIPFYRAAGILPKREESK